MPIEISKLILVGTAATLLFACAPAPIRDIENAPINVPSTEYDLSDVTRAIKVAGIGLGWNIEVQTPGHIVGRLHLRSHVAFVDITYTRDEYSIHYRDSSNLNYDAGSQSIHKNYNSWVRDLAQAIDRHPIAM